MFLLDTCKSGVIMNADWGDGFTRLSHKTLPPIIDASSDIQDAIVGYEGHGVFSYTLKYKI